MTLCELLNEHGVIETFVFNNGSVIVLRLTLYWRGFSHIGLDHLLISPIKQQEEFNIYVLITPP
ncbi:hypothetical protein VCR6J2_610313 [Vibrio coralliirubri]|nr:hypothetical protein VCR6J2_610313 [Vibrio coralliirubri]CDT83390.1 hypothetical protein VCR8J2_240032 [Vibrio coralliirubri]